MINEWYYQRDGEEIGPVPFEEIKSLAKSGQLSPDDQIRDAVSGMLLPAKSIGGLFPPANAGQNAAAARAAQASRRSQSSRGAQQSRGSQQSRESQQSRSPQATAQSAKSAQPGQRRRSRNRDDDSSSKERRSRQRTINEESQIGRMAAEAMDEQENRYRERSRKKAAAVSTGGGRYESPSANTRRAASQISEYAEKINDQEESTSSWIAALEELKEHPIKLTILFICIAAGIFKYLPERDYSPRVYEEFSQIYFEMDQRLNAEDGELDWEDFAEQSQGEIRTQIEKLQRKETRSPAEKQLISIGWKLLALFESRPDNMSELARKDVVRSLNNVREKIE